jgi:signal transduction histidine kinase
MSPEEVPVIIEPFQQAESSLSRRTNCSRLVVPIAIALLQPHDGRSDVKSEPNVGTIVLLLLPPERVLNR